jgi:hypothetical protein
LSERSPQNTDLNSAELERCIRDLAAGLTPDLLDELEREPGYATWSLRLSPHVPHDDTARRAQRFAQDPDPDVRYWAHVSAEQAK